ncbi:nuclear envelope phosphatase-regulatory subunit 1-like [Styela clava]|uniref:nuclear envelope phosphatase-regulatory subunit 1-like n=1 Tax=Styela clava TaxID=7725 RepID=UPI00193969B3|nr:nuclear envelope phosphatase-regulatory subunit 1-like [Styela clava]
MLRTMNQNIADQRDDLKAFERRIMECITHMQPSTSRWRMVLVIISVCTAIGAWLWLVDPNTSREPFLHSLWQHPFFTLSSAVLILLFFAGIHKRVVAPSIIAGRLQTVLDDFNMSCDETGRLILRPRTES